MRISTEFKKENLSLPKDEQSDNTCSLQKKQAHSWIQRASLRIPSTKNQRWCKTKLALGTRWRPTSCIDKALSDPGVLSINFMHRCLSDAGSPLHGQTPRTGPNAADAKSRLRLFFPNGWMSVLSAVRKVPKMPPKVKDLTSST
ncbi:hypothetical protein PABG_04247 [Paracoccidioides brasiliensis Pb03]|nr:hypothetical protein PABG_04247 [Paracoccidioides brasiliensis Pb03]